MAEKEVVSPWPPMMNMAPKGFRPGPLISSFVLCSGNVEYYLADVLVPPLYRWGLRPNDVTTINCFVRGLCIHAVRYDSGYPAIILLLVVQQVLDCADGQMARRYRCGSAWGAFYDHITDMIFGTILLATCLYKVHEAVGVASLQFVGMGCIGIAMGILGSACMYVKDCGLAYDRLTVLQTLGVWQEWYMSYIYIVLVGVCAMLGSG